jgi:hypothetical protein
MRGHQLAISLIRSGRKKVQVTRRYAFASGHRVVSIFFFTVSRILISDLVDLSRTFSVLTEDLIQVYLNVVLMSVVVKTQHRPAVSDSIAAMRASWTQPCLMSDPRDGVQRKYQVLKCPGKGEVRPPKLQEAG